MDPISEITELHADEGVHGVQSPANGASFLLIKATDTEDCSTCDGTGKILAGNRKCPDCAGSGKVSKSDSPEADEQEEEMTKGAYCGDGACEVCVITDEQGTRFHPAVKALSGSDRKKMPASSFAFVDKNGAKHLPIHDEGHVKSALGRHGQTDFSEAKGDPADAKKAAAKKIVGAAKKFGMDVDDKSAVAQAAKSAQQDALGGLDEPKAAGSLDGSKSGLAGAVATGLAEQPPNASQTLGGASSYETPLEQRVTDNKPAPATLDPAGIIPQIAKTVQEFAELVEARASRVVKDAKVLSLTPPQGDAALSPGSPAWESHDAATLQQVGDCLASCCNALDTIAQRERTEGATVDPADAMNAWDLEEAEQALEYALGVVARLSFHEAAEGQATKAGRVLSGKNHDALAAARDHLQAVIDGAQGKKPASADDSDKESDKIMTTLTKDELAESIAAGSAAAVKAAFDHQDEQRKAKKARKKEQAEKEAAEKENAIDAGAPAETSPKGHADANDVTAIPDGGSVDPKFVKSEGDEPSLADLAKQIAEQGELLAKIAKRPRQGGPALGGQVPQGAGDLASAAKEQDEISRLEKAVADAKAVGTPEQVQWAGEALTKARLFRLNAAMGWPAGS